ncbi:FAD-dependent oxidoreductase [Verrucomicrobia bacterium]|nr:FAD-dependent oxidoreductase [Verrucomicrobiota bacterium]
MKKAKNQIEIVKKRLAIIGTGISGMTCGYFLHKHFDVQLFEQNSHVGGHSLTIDAEEGSRKVPIDMGFMVFNKKTYPNLTRLFNELDVPIKNSKMSFSVQHLSLDLEFCGSSLNHLFAQRANLLRPRFWRMLLQINRFNKEALFALESGDFDTLTLQEYVEEKGYGEDFLSLYIIPMSSAIWSAPPKLMLQFPATTLLRFFHNHGFLGLDTQHQWLTPDGGSKQYVHRLTSSFKKNIRTSDGVTKIIRENGKVTVRTQNGRIEAFDKVIMASHADQSLKLLDQPCELESRLLSRFLYQKNMGTLHTDASQMPKRQLCWASWNYRIKKDDEGNLHPRTIYWMNSLQDVSEKENYFVSINGKEEIKEDKIIKQVEFEHPLFDGAAVGAQSQLIDLNNRSEDQSVYFCGSYFKFGFHEDALVSAMDLCSTILKRPLWN